MTKTTSALRDRELVTMLADNPELLAIADALVETRQDLPTTRPRLRSRWWQLPSVVLAASVSAAVVSILLIAPWGGSDALVGRALAAVGRGQVIHIVTEQASPAWYKPVALPSGKPITVTERQEIWFDPSLDLKKTVTTLNGLTYHQTLETAQGGFTSTGFVYTCDWITAHPVEAAQARVGCGDPTKSGAARTQAGSPTTQSGSAPTLDLALAGFVDHYRTSLATGRATRIGSGKLHGDQVIWLRINATSQRVGGYPTEDVAIDASTYVPTFVRTVGPQRFQFRVTQINTQAYDASLFARPRRVYPPTSGQVEGTTRIKANKTRSLLDGRALWLGERWHSYQLVGVERQQLRTGYGRLSHKKSLRSVGVIFTYAPISGGSTRDSDLLQIKEATQCEMAWAMPCGAIHLTEGTLLLGRLLSSNVTVRDGLYIAISQRNGNPVAVANALRVLNAG